jgi:hypothetical protein
VFVKANPTSYWCKAGFGEGFAAVLVFLCLGCGEEVDPACSGAAKTHLADATNDSSVNLLPEPSQWIDVGLVVDTGAFGSWDTVMEGITPVAIVRRDGRFLLYYVGADDYISDLRNIGPAHRAIGVAVSLDGIHWTKPSQTWGRLASNQVDLTECH